MTEGLSSLFAALVLLSVGLWMHQKSAAGLWQVYLKEKLSSAMLKRSAWALFGLSFIAVYREVFETVLSTRPSRPMGMAMPCWAALVWASLSWLSLPG